MKKSIKFLRWLCCLFEVFAFPAFVGVCGWIGYATVVEINHTTGFPVLFLFIGLIATVVMGLVALYQAARNMFNNKLLEDFVTTDRETKAHFIKWCRKNNVNPRYFLQLEVKPRKEDGDNVSHRN